MGHILTIRSTETAFLLLGRKQQLITQHHPQFAGYFFDKKHYSFFCLVIHLHRDHLVTTSQLSHILTNTPKQHIFN